MTAELLDRLKGIVGADRVAQNVSMREYTTFHIGGPAQVFVTPAGEKELAQSILFCQEEKIPWTLIGNGSNLLVSDRGLKGVVLQTRSMNTLSLEGTVIKAQCGCSLSAIAHLAYTHSLTGLEFASGIPGSLGGAVRMNAGAYGGEMKNVVRSVRVLNKEGRIEEIAGQDMAFGYRTSRVATTSLTVLSATMTLQEGSKEEIGALMKRLNGQRREKQPLDKPSAGSTFKRPEGYFAGKLIMDAGLGGFRVGDAAVSTKHCGFVVNEGQASAADVYQLIRQVQQIVLDKYGVKLEPEVLFLGEFE